MKKTFFVVSIHSFVDVITNSSTELFVASGEKSADMVRGILEEKWPYYKALYNDTGSEALSDCLTVTLADEETVKDYHENWADDYPSLKHLKVGDVLITGTDDNSIPYKFFDVIEDSFNCKRYHLG